MQKVDAPNPCVTQGLRFYVKIYVWIIMIKKDSLESFNIWSHDTGSQFEQTNLSSNLLPTWNEILIESLFKKIQLSDIKFKSRVICI